MKIATNMSRALWGTLRQSVSDDTIFDWGILLPMHLVFYDHEVAKSMPEPEVQEWCASQCSGQFTQVNVEPTTRLNDIILLFELERDAILFKVFFG